MLHIDQFIYDQITHSEPETDPYELMYSPPPEIKKEPVVRATDPSQIPF